MNTPRTNRTLMNNVAISLADIKAGIDGGMYWEGSNSDDAFAMPHFDVVTLQHHMVDASNKKWSVPVLRPGPPDG